MPKALALAPVACALATGCLAHDYAIGAGELQRLAARPAEERGERIRVTQQTSFSSDIGDADRQSMPTVAWWVEDRPAAHRPVPTAPARHDAGPAEEALAAIVVVGVIAA